jgi:SAM-dependent methyltransferase
VHAPAFDRSALPYWEARSTRWRVSTPISPLPDDIRFYEAHAARHAGEEDEVNLHALLLGVTPAIVTMRWPMDTRLVALDWSEGMFRNVFPHRGVAAFARSVRGDWREMPLADHSIDFVVGDGCYSTFPTLEGPAQLNREVARVLRPGGLFCLRCHRRADQPVALEQLFGRLLAGEFRDLDMFRWQLAMSVHGESRDGVCLGDVWTVWRDHVPDSRKLQASFGWSDDAIANMDGWKESRSRYFFPTLAQLRELVSADFDLDDCDIPEYEWGEHFPRLTMSPRSS